MKKAIIALSVAALMTTSTAFATNGYFSHGYSTAEKGMGGAGVAYSQDSLASATNPAGLVNVGERLDIGLALFNPNREYTASVPTNRNLSLMPGTYESDNDVFAIPHVGMTSQYNDYTVGLAVYGNGGMNTEYNGVVNQAGFPDGTFASGTAGVDLKQVFLNFSVARKVGTNNSVGISVIGAAQTFEATGLSMFGGVPMWGVPDMSVDNTKLTDNGVDTSYGAGYKLGWQGKVANSLTLGASYQSKIWMDEFDDYAGLFADAGSFDIPATATVGLAWNTSPSTVLVIDVQQIYYSDVKALNNGVENLQLPDGTGRLGGSNGAGFGWDDMTVYKVGYEFGQNTKWRVGASYGEQPIRDGQTTFNILAPAVITTHYTAGFTTPVSDNAEISVSGMYAPSNDITAPMALNPTAQDVTIAMDQYELQVGYALKF